MSSLSKESSRSELYEEVKLYHNPRDRERYDNLADLYSIIVSLQALEKAYIRDCVDSKEYTVECSKLLTQYKPAFKQIECQFGSIEDFLKKYKLDCPAALERIREGKPVTIRGEGGNTCKLIADTVSLFITIMDKLKLNIRANDMLQQDLRELHDLFHRLTILPKDYAGKEKLQKWIVMLMPMGAAEELTDIQARNIHLDLEVSFDEFNRILHNYA
ncbi:hypothetical protein GJ496_007444 [Pomphorhynchus laevis]|nr:hypothetical protein GJ496_007444 [Pomphorhynchus laevis]